MISDIIWNIDPRIIHDLEFPRWYGVCWLAGIVLAYLIVLKIYKSEGIPAIELDRLTVYVLLGAVIGARLGHVFFYDPVYYFNNPVEILPFRTEPTFQFTGLAGLASHGGILGALLGLYIYTRKYKKDYLWQLDKLMIGGAALGAFIRLGNLVNSEVIGIPSDLPWSFIFTAVDDVPRHPTQLYEAICYLIISIALYFFWKSKKFQNNTGFIFGLGLTLIFICRFLIEFLKENQVGFEDGMMLNMGQVLSVPMVVLGMWVMGRNLKFNSVSI